MSRSILALLKKQSEAHFPDSSHVYVCQQLQMDHEYRVTLVYKQATHLLATCVQLYTC